MFARKPKLGEPSELDKAIARVHEKLGTTDPTTDAYAQALDQLSKLHALKSKPPSNRVSPDTMAIVLGNFLGIVVIVAYESRNVITSKALGFIGKATR